MSNILKREIEREDLRGYLLGVFGRKPLRVANFPEEVLPPATTWTCIFVPLFMSSAFA